MAYNKNLGVIVECLEDQHGPITHTVVDLINKKTFYISRSSFEACREFPEIRSRCFKGERAYENFDNISFDADENGIIRSFVARNQNRWDCLNPEVGVFAVKSICVFSDDEPARCFTDAVGEVPCDPRSYSKVLCRNVTFDCTVRFNFRRAEDFINEIGNNDVTFELYEIEQINPDKFDFALEAPWFKRIQRPMYESIDPFEVEYDPTKVKKMTEIFGIVVGKNTVYLPTKPRWRVLLASNQIGTLKNDSQQIQHGMFVIVNARYNAILDRFIVYETNKHRFQKNLNLRVWHPHRIRGTLSTFSEIPGYFLWHRSLVFDKYGLLSKLYGKSASTIADFGYMDSDDRAYTTLIVADAQEDKWLDVKNMVFVGLCINKNEFYCSQLHQYLLFADDKFEVGLWYDLEVVKVNYDTYIAQVKPTLNVSQEPTLYKKVADNYEFLVSCVWHHEGGCHFLFGKQIGVIGVAGNQLPRSGARENKACSVRFGKPIEDYLERPQNRPKLARYYPDYNETSNNLEFL